jgi:hypothetical protein
MILSIAGAMVCMLLALLGWVLGAPLIIGLFASLPFGSTAIATLPAIGGSSPLIYTVFAAGLLLMTAAHRGVLQELGTVFLGNWLAWTILLLVIFVLAGSYIFPRLFAGDTITFVTSRKGISETLLSPSSGNITQPAYFALGVLTFFTFCVYLLKARNLQTIKQGFWVFIVIHIALGLIDLLGKIAGAGDILLPIRTASYSMLTTVFEAGFWRIVGGYSEASAYGATTLACLGFSFTYWKLSRSQFAFFLTLVLVVLLLLSTSSAAYAGVAVMAIPAFALIVGAAIRDRLTLADMLIVGGGIVAFILVFAVYVLDEQSVAPFIELFEEMVLNKAESSSAKERFYWNATSLASFPDTYGLGIGMGSSRSSSWIISVISQLGFIGTLLISVLVYVLFTGIGRRRSDPNENNINALSSSAAVAALAGLVAQSIAGGTADPGLFFFIALATVWGCKRHLKQGVPLSLQKRAVA